MIGNVSKWEKLQPILTPYIFLIAGKGSKNKKSDQNFCNKWN